MTDVGELSRFVLSRLDEDEERFNRAVLPHLDEAERRGRIRVTRAGGDERLLLVPGPAEAPEDRIPVPFPEKVEFLRREAEAGGDPATLGLLASVYDTHPDWQERWRP
jgi:hypothetical protein